MKTNEKDTRQGVVPALRFPEFNNYYWDIKELYKIATLIKERARNGNYIPMSVTSGVGLVPQKEKFGRDISGNQYSSYFVIRKGDFAYNKSATSLYPEGYISMLKNFETAAVPNSIFTCFKISREKVLPEYLNYLFENNYHGKWIRKFIEVGARAHGSLSIDTKKLFELPIVFPSISEQQKIAECLSSIDNLIKAAENKIDELKAHKKGLMQQLFPAEGETVPALRFPEFQNAGEWTKISLGELTYKVSKKNKAGKLYPIYSINNKQGFIRQEEQFTGVDSNDRGYDLSLYSIVGSKTFAYNPARINVGSIGYSGELKDVIISSLYVCFKTSETVNDEFLLKYFETESFKKAVLNSVEGGIRSYLFYDNFAKINLYLPPNYDIAEQQKIADCLSSVDDLIMAQTNRLEALRSHKKGLMQQLFPNINEC